MKQVYQSTKRQRQHQKTIAATRSTAYIFANALTISPNEEWSIISSMLNSAQPPNCCSLVIKTAAETKSPPSAKKSL